MIINMKKHINNGFTLIESIFSLFIITISMSLLIQTLPVIRRILHYDLNIEEESKIELLIPCK